MKMKCFSWGVFGDEMTQGRGRKRGRRRSKREREKERKSRSWSSQISGLLAGLMPLRKMSNNPCFDRISLVSWSDSFFFLFLFFLPPAVCLVLPDSRKWP